MTNSTVSLYYLLAECGSRGYVLDVFTADRVEARDKLIRLNSVLSGHRRPEELLNFLSVLDRYRITESDTILRVGGMIYCQDEQFSTYLFPMDEVVSDFQSLPRSKESAVSNEKDNACDFPF